MDGTTERWWVVPIDGPSVDPHRDPRAEVLDQYWCEECWLKRDPADREPNAGLWVIPLMVRSF